MSQAFHIVTLDVPFEEADAVSGILHQSGCLGLEEQETGSTTTLKAYFPDEGPLTGLLSRIGTIVPMATKRDGTTISLSDIRFSPQTFEPVELADGWWIVPPADMPTNTTVETPNKLVIRPGAAFGTGRHESTQLAAEGILYAVRKRETSGQNPISGNPVSGHPASVLDIGTGSGILAVFAAKNGFNPVVAVEIDAESRINASENFGLNELDIEIFDDLAKVSNRFDLVVANILAPTLIYLKPRLISLLKPGGFLILSGLVENEGDAIEKAFTELDIKTKNKKNEWISYVYGTRTL